MKLFPIFCSTAEKLDDILTLCTLSYCPICGWISLNCCLEFHETLGDSLQRQWKVGGSFFFQITIAVLEFL